MMNQSKPMSVFLPLDTLTALVEKEDTTYKPQTGDELTVKMILEKMDGDKATLTVESATCNESSDWEPGNNPTMADPKIAEVKAMQQGMALRSRAVKMDRAGGKVS